MCSSCIPFSLVSEPRSSGFSRRLRRIFISPPRRFWRFLRQTLQCVCGADRDLDEAWVIRNIREGSLETLLEHLVPAFVNGQFSFIKIFLGTYRTYATTQQVLEQLFQRYGCNHPTSATDTEPRDQLIDAISFILTMWLMDYPDDFDEPPHFPCLKLVLEYVQLNMPGSHLERCARCLRAKLDQQEVTEAELEAPEPGQGPLVNVSQDPSLPQEPTSTLSVGVRSGTIPAPDLHSPSPTKLTAPAAGPDREAAGGPDTYPELPPELTPRPPADVEPLRAPIQELEVAQVHLQLHQQHQMSTQMLILGHFQNPIEGQEPRSTLALLPYRSSAEHLLFYYQLQFWQLMHRELEVEILNLADLYIQHLNHLSMLTLFFLRQHQRSIEYRLSHHHRHHCHQKPPQEMWDFTVGNVQNTLQDDFLSEIHFLEQQGRWVQRHVIRHQVTHLMESLLEGQILFLGQHLDRRRDCLMSTVVQTDVHWHATEHPHQLEGWISTLGHLQQAPYTTPQMDPVPAASSAVTLEPPTLLSPPSPALPWTAQAEPSATSLSHQYLVHGDETSASSPKHLSAWVVWVCIAVIVWLNLYFIVYSVLDSIV